MQNQKVLEASEVVCLWNLRNAIREAYSLKEDVVIREDLLCQLLDVLRHSREYED